MTTHTKTSGKKLKQITNYSIPVTLEDALSYLDQPIGRYHTLSRTNQDGTKTLIPMQTKKHCANCNKGYGKNPPLPSGSGKCGRCQQVNYCNAVCQRQHWHIHKEVCQSMVDQRQQCLNSL